MGRVSHGLMGNSENVSSKFDQLLAIFSFSLPCLFLLFSSTGERGGRENPCEICDHYHKQEETCGVCGHRVPVSISVDKESAFPFEILKDFLYLGSYDHASWIQVLKTFGISHILNVVHASRNLYNSTFIYHHLQDDESSFDDEIQFIVQTGTGSVLPLKRVKIWDLESKSIVQDLKPTDAP
ncbi:protein-tyrosine-phosphatase IBR5-like [Asparagus officinalis]|uniref:protein-tyrosine-phosphatase IBR5-like n=1 Tax=Asparagus officinalis TaxID=4686 RepID=UPI00098DF45D|nr:protein-tyrosine-phosphatase IBR5-like [Asparagus officinalis]